MTSGVMPTPLSRIVIATPSAVRRLPIVNSGWYSSPSTRARSATAWQALVTRLVQTRAKSSCTATISPRLGSSSCRTMALNPGSWACAA